MKKVYKLLLAGVFILSLAGCSRAGRTKESTSGQEKKVLIEQYLRIKSQNGQNIIVSLNGSPAAQSLYNQLPLSVRIENYSDNEKIFYPPKNLKLRVHRRQRDRQESSLIMLLGETSQFFTENAEVPAACMNLGRRCRAEIRLKI